MNEQQRKVDDDWGIYDLEQVQLPNGGHNKDGTLTLSPRAARLLMVEISCRGGGILKPNGHHDKWLDEMAELLQGQGLEWEQKT